MKELLKQLAVYNIWANQKILDTILALPAELHTREIPSSFNSLQSTIMHMWDAESVWWQRLKLQERVIRPSENFKGNIKDAADGLLQQNKQWNDWVTSASESMLDHVFQYYNDRKESFKHPINLMLIHVFNHGTYHRGQLVNMLRQLEVKKIPQTDFIVWGRKK